jgi:hypothetical protein
LLHVDGRESEDEEEKSDVTIHQVRGTVGRGRVCRLWRDDERSGSDYGPEFAAEHIRTQHDGADNAYERQQR